MHKIKVCDLKQTLNLWLHPMKKIEELMIMMGEEEDYFLWIWSFKQLWLWERSRRQENPPPPGRDYLWIMDGWLALKEKSGLGRKEKHQLNLSLQFLLLMQSNSVEASREISVIHVTWRAGYHKCFLRS